MIKIRSQKFIVIIVCLMTWSLSFFGCKHTTELNKLCGEERKCFITSITPANPRAWETLTINLHVDICNDYKDGKITLSYILPGDVDPELITYWDIDKTANPTYDLNGTFAPPSQGLYTFLVELYKPKPVDPNEAWVSTERDWKYIQVGPGGMVSYPIIQLETQYTTQVGTETVTKVNSLWPNDDEHDKYIGAVKRDIAFMVAGVALDIKETKSNLIQPNFGDDGELQNWVYRQVCKKSDWSDLNKNVTIICGISDVPENIVASEAEGYCMPRGILTTQKNPAIAVILEKRYRDISYLDEFNKKLHMVGGAIHELGHSTGIQGDDPYPGHLNQAIYPAHSGENSSDCLMLSPSTTDTYSVSPHFCGGHIDYIKHTSVTSLVIWRK